MAAIVDTRNNHRRTLEPELLVGRGPSCGLCLEERHVSSRHALLRWNDEYWEVRDLGSTNGTFVDQTRLRSKESKRLAKGSRLAFGRQSPEWELVDDSPPTCMAIPLDGSEPVAMVGDLLGLPDDRQVLATIYRNSEGHWTLEKVDDSSTPIANQQVFDVGGKSFRFCCVETVPKTSTVEFGRELEARYLQLVFSVSRDEEFVSIQVNCGDRVFDMGAHAYNYLLLTLARRRLEDIASGLADAACGWIDQDDLAHDPSMSGPQLNLDVFRIRKKFAEIGICDAATIVERRTRTRQLRIGASRLVIARL